MSFSKLFSFILLMLCLFYHTVFGDYLNHVCLSSQNFTTNDPYETNLKELLTYISYEAPSTGFSMGSKGEGQNRTVGLALCRGDVSATNCMACIKQASNEILSTYCPNAKGAVVWYDSCALKYLNERFFGKIDYNNMYVVQNNENVSDPTLFGLRTQNYFDQLTQKAIGHPKMHASGKFEIGESDPFYGLVQCTRDLSSLDCKKCLSDSVSWLEKCCLGSKGARMYSGTCIVRYELYQIFNTTGTNNTCTSQIRHMA